MAHVITRACCNDAACVWVCPKNCIHPMPGDPGFATAEMLKIDPVNCIDCGACVEVCPVDAIVPDYQLRPDQHDYLELNREYFVGRTYEQAGFMERPPTIPAAGLTVALVGSGPAAMYAVEHLLENMADDGEVHVYERLPAPWGLVRYGVAPDHQDTKQVIRGFERIAADPRVRMHLNVEVGRDVTHEQLLSHHHAVVYAVGAPDSRDLAIPGEALPGSISATSFVAWYNGHPDFSDLDPDLSGRRVVVVGNGNVALDVARVLASGHLDVERSDIADHALQALQSSAVDEIVVLGRRGPAEAAYTTPELLSMIGHPNIEVAVDGLQGNTDAGSGLKERLVQRLAAGQFSAGDAIRRQVRLRYLASPAAILGETKVTGVRVECNELVVGDGAVCARPTGHQEDLECSLVIHAVGYRGRPIPGVPFEDDRALVPNDAGRVLDGERALTGAYVVGWSKRGPSGVIGTNKSCAAESIDGLLDDHRAGLLPEPTHRPEDLGLSDASLGHLGWQRLDAHEREAGRASSRPRAKVSDRALMLAIGRGEPSS
jgi:ferredoxin--NADP+ reductase